MVVVSESSSVVFSPIKLGALSLGHRVIHAPTTRCRAKESSVAGVYNPRDVSVEYYKQRSTPGGLLITEACPISRTACGYPGVAGLFTPEQVAGWKAITDAVHSNGGLIVCQLWHVGRATIPQLLDGETPISSTETPLKGPGPVPGTTYAENPPRAMTEQDIEEVTKQFAEAAKRAVDEAGFDGVEIHGANGYLLDQFLHDNVNTRTDKYGGQSMENRARFPLKVVKAVTDAIGADRVGIRLSPYNYFQDTKDSNPVAMWSYVCEQIAALDNPLAYVHMVEPRFDEVLDEQDKLKSLKNNCVPKTLSLNPFREILATKDIKFISAGGFNLDLCISKLSNKEADAVAFGRWFISNPDLVTRFRNGLPLNAYDRNTFYGAPKPEEGYITYPFYQAASDPIEA